MDEAPLPRLFGPEQVVDPHPAYRELRERHPVCPVTLPNGMTKWFVTRYADACVALTDPRLTKNPEPVRDALRASGTPFFSAAFDPLNAHMLNADGADHLRQRRPVSAAFAARRIEALRPRAGELAAELLDALAGRDDCDLLADYAHPLPLLVICELLGLPRADQPRLLGWSQAVFGLPMAAPTTPDEATLALTGYVRAVIADRRRAAGPPTDPIGELARSPQLSEPEVVGNVMLLLLSGHSSTSDFIGNAVHALLRHPAERDRLVAHPELLDTAVEELLRWDSSVYRATMRIAAEDVPLGGAVIPRGAMVGVVVGAADRDPAAFADPDRLELGRADNPHLAFGHGVHYCLGAALARMVSAVALRALFGRYPRLDAAVPLDQLPWQDPESGIGRNLERFPVRLRGAAG